MTSRPPPDPAFALAEQDVRDVIRLLGEVIAAPGDIQDKRRLLMDGVCGLIGATAWVWAKIVHIVLSEVPWLHYHAYPDKPSQQLTGLYPRHRTVLNCMCEGWSRKKIAEHLGLTTNTIHGYSKVIFKHFGVHSQAELLARFTLGDGGDR